MKTPPEALDEGALLRCLADAWGLEVEAADYAPVGFGSYHWVVADSAGRRWFVTVDDLDQKPWLGGERDSAFDGLRRAFETAAALRDAGLAFVVAPVRTREREVVRRIGSRHSVALFPFVDAEVGRFGDSATAGDRAEVVSLLVELHRATPYVRGVARTDALELDGRADLESALRELNVEWRGGPFSEPARRLIARHASDLAALLAVFDRLANELATSEAPSVVTHGEPHAANVLRTAEGRLLVDWDTVAVAPPERDLWMVSSDTGEEADLYERATGRRVDSRAIDFFGIRWDLAEVATYVGSFRSPHHQTADTIEAFDQLAGYANVQERWGAVIGRA